MKIQDAFRVVKDNRQFLVRQYLHARKKEKECKDRGDEKGADMYWGLKRGFLVSWKRCRIVSVQIGGNCYAYRNLRGGAQ